jgi:endo-1,4-beta-xylanase
VRCILRQHITDTVSRYAGRIHAWDVVNEAFNDDGTLHQDSFWYQRLGAGYIADAFRSARAADPTARLFINEYNIERINSKSTALYEYVRGLRDDGVSIDGVGFQNHITVNNELTGFTDNLQRVTGLGSDRHFQLVANHSRRCVDVVARSTADGARIQQWGCHANPTTYRNQVFRLPNAPGGHP